MLTRIGEAGADAFTIMKLAGLASVTVSRRYVHPTPEAVERAFDRLETLNRLALDEISEVNGSHKITHSKRRYRRKLLKGL